MKHNSPTMHLIKDIVNVLESSDEEDVEKTVSDLSKDIDRVIDVVSKKYGHSAYHGKMNVDEMDVKSWAHYKQMVKVILELLHQKLSELASADSMDTKANLKVDAQQINDALHQIHSNSKKLAAGAVKYGKIGSKLGMKYGSKGARAGLKYGTKGAMKSHDFFKHRVEDGKRNWRDYKEFREFQRQKEMKSSADADDSIQTRLLENFGFTTNNMKMKKYNDKSTTSIIAELDVTRNVMLHTVFMIADDRSYMINSNFSSKFWGDLYAYIINKIVPNEFPNGNLMGLTLSKSCNSIRQYILGIEETENGPSTRIQTIIKNLNDDVVKPNKVNIDYNPSEKLEENETSYASTVLMANRIMFVLSVCTQFACGKPMPEADFKNDNKVKSILQLLADGGTTDDKFKGFNALKELMPAGKKATVFSSTRLAFVKTYVLAAIKSYGELDVNSVDQSEAPKDSSEQDNVDESGPAERPTSFFKPNEARATRSGNADGADSNQNSNETTTTASERRSKETNVIENRSASFADLRNHLAEINGQAQSQSQAKSTLPPPRRQTRSSSRQQGQQDKPNYENLENFFAKKGAEMNQQQPPRNTTVSSSQQSEPKNTPEARQGKDRSKKNPVASDPVSVLYDNMNINELIQHLAAINQSLELLSQTKT